MLYTKEQLLGCKLTEELRQEIKEQESGTRFLKEGSCYTADFKPYRSNIVIDKDNTIIDVWKG